MKGQSSSVTFPITSSFWYQKSGNWWKQDLCSRKRNDDDTKRRVLDQLFGQYFPSRKLPGACKCIINRFQYKRKLRFPRTTPVAFVGENKSYRHLDAIDVLPGRLEEDVERQQCLGKTDGMWTEISVSFHDVTREKWKWWKMFDLVDGAVLWKGKWFNLQLLSKKESSQAHANKLQRNFFSFKCTTWNWSLIQFQALNVKGKKLWREKVSQK